MLASSPDEEEAGDFVGGDEVYHRIIESNLIEGQLIYRHVECITEV